MYLLCLLELFQADVDEFCQYYGRRGSGLCFPDFQRRQLLGQDSNYLEDEKIEDISRFVAWIPPHFIFIREQLCFIEYEKTNFQVSYLFMCLIKYSFQSSEFRYKIISYDFYDMKKVYLWYDPYFHKMYFSSFPYLILKVYFAVLYTVF